MLSHNVIYTTKWQYNDREGFEKAFIVCIKYAKIIYKYLKGPAVETEKCGNKLGTGLECFYGNSIGSEIAAEIPEIQAEVGPYCRCGCVVHLGQAKPKRLLATSSQSCPGRTFWLIQVRSYPFFVYLCYVIFLREKFKPKPLKVR